MQVLWFSTVTHRLLKGSTPKNPWLGSQWLKSDPRNYKNEQSSKSPPIKKSYLPSVSLVMKHIFGIQKWYWHLEVYVNRLKFHSPWLYKKLGQKVKGGKKSTHRPTGLDQHIRRSIWQCEGKQWKSDKKLFFPNCFLETNSEIWHGFHFLFFNSLISNTKVFTKAHISEAVPYSGVHLRYTS